LFKKLGLKHTAHKKTGGKKRKMREINRSIKVPKDKTPIDENRKAEKGEVIVVLAEYDYNYRYYDDYVGATYDFSELEKAMETAKEYKRRSVKAKKEIFVGVYNDKGKLCFWAR